MNAQTVIVAGWWTVDPHRRDEVVESFKEGSSIDRRSVTHVEFGPRRSTAK